MKEGTRSGLWSEFARAIDIVRPSVVVIENVRGLISADAGGEVEPCPWCMGNGADEYHLRALDAVLADLSDLGFDTEWGGLRAADVGAPHGRFRFFLVAYARGVRFERPWPTRGRRVGSAHNRLRGDREVALFPTPMVGSSNPAAHGQISGDFRRRMGEALEQIRLLPTPTASEGEKGGPGQKHGNGDSTLSGTVGALSPRKLLGTPTTSVDGSGADMEKREKRVQAAREKHGRPFGETLGVQIAQIDGTREDIDWGTYEPAVRLWESLTRPAPAPTLPDGKNGNHRLAAVFPEWMMGYPAGWVTDVIGRNAAIKACGNGVVPQQAYAALGILWDRVLEHMEERAA